MGPIPVLCTWSCPSATRMSSSPLPTVSWSCTESTAEHWIAIQPGQRTYIHQRHTHKKPNQNLSILKYKHIHIVCVPPRSLLDSWFLRHKLSLECLTWPTHGQQQFDLTVLVLAGFSEKTKAYGVMQPVICLFICLLPIASFELVS